MSFPICIGNSLDYEEGLTGSIISGLGVEVKLVKEYYDPLLE